ncbi:MAG: protein phosphatase 2C domain-containing protein [Lentisphaeria bacterium]|nr:protein phosphatase 2C domain-containing protein [Lentisphaeria bacterium]
MTEHTEIEKKQDVLEMLVDIPKDSESSPDIKASGTEDKTFTNAPPLENALEASQVSGNSTTSSISHAISEVVVSENKEVKDETVLPSISVLRINKAEKQIQQASAVPLTFREKVSSLRFPNAMQNHVYKYDFSIDILSNGNNQLDILAVGIEPASCGITAKIEEGMVKLFGIPKEKGVIKFWVEYGTSEKNENFKRLKEFSTEFTIFPDPKALWKNLPVDESAPYQTPNEAKDGLYGISGKNILLASKRGRSHAHEGKFRDDSFSFSWISEFGWLIVAVSDGAGSAEYSRKGSEIACESFVSELKNKLSSADTNQKIDSLDKRNQEMALERLLFSTAHQAALKIKDIANENQEPVKKYSATFLGYIAKKFEDEWLVVSVGIGDGAIALLDMKNNIHLLNEPDGGEYVGQTRFLTTPEVWQDTCKRTFSVRVHDFQCVFAMTDGVSDPMFETDNNLKNSQKWVEFWNNLKNSEEYPIHFCNHEEQTQEELLSWLDFWSKGNHDDRTLVVFY